MSATGQIAQQEPSGASLMGQVGQNFPHSFPYIPTSSHFCCPCTYESGVSVAVTRYSDIRLDGYSHIGPISSHSVPFLLSCPARQVLHP